MEIYDKTMNRYYTKKELALLYFPSSQPHTAVTRLSYWMGRCVQLTEALRTTGYNKNAKGFTPRQASLIFDYLGEP